MNNIRFFDSIAVSEPKEKIYRRLGYKKASTKLNSIQREEIEHNIAEAVSMIVLQGAGIRIPIIEKDRFSVKLSTGIDFQSSDVAKMLANSCEVLLVGATAGRAIMEAIHTNTEAGNITRGIIFDAAASEMVDVALNWIVQFFSHELLRENKRFTSARFSCGYGDFALENQANIYKALELEHFGVELTESHIMIPEKSVTAVVGIE